mmetsp:Transcript_1990/g.5278  ORF Transcript_1990/g.5278 Transcript_1990/m.5278 type:complete len:663 (-) Transcript_1990:1420-3408(-)|eukprot:CAMPEP_0172368910 /NCGR_PEP_ID=MMETSP1060-20121228/29635_1 /TAXON_ID=37318 /ORGANISM="Pseudo-nitzschia pungens, Strain cf. cingulata" /LENGTH=662 /DNA_ID=CAMNT_0013093651 /DNA_START=246 /DNA_END=2234 /DNA_ORIENTATION=+
MRRGRCFEKIMMMLQMMLISLLLLLPIRNLVNLHNYLPGTRCVDAFVLRQHNRIILRRPGNNQHATIRTHNEGSVCRLSEGIHLLPFNQCSNKKFPQRDTRLFESVVRDTDDIDIVTGNEPDKLLTRERTAHDASNEGASASASSASTSVSSAQRKSSSSTSRIEVRMPDAENSSVAAAASSSSSSSAVESLRGEDGTTMTRDDKTALLGKMKNKSVEKNTVDVPQPTANGGYSHTKASRAKISAANKGKTPWNKGKARSPEVKARIAAGVRARNRQVFLQKLEDMGVTEEEYEAKKKEERRIKEAERRSRRTANGGYRPTEETKKKISRILKEKHAKGEVKQRAKLDPNKVRRGFTHSEETRRKISESLKKRWQNDEEFQEMMKESFTNREDVRRKISESLKKKWQDPEFRSGMMDKISKRKSGKDAMSYDKDHRKKISEAMKRKWQDSTYREKTLTSIKKSAETRKASNPKRKPKASGSKSSASVAKSKAPGVEEVKPMTAGDIPKRKTKKKRVVRKRAPAKKAIKVDKIANANTGGTETEEVPAVTAVRKPRTQPDKVKGVTSSTKTSSAGVSSVVDADGPAPTKEKKKKKKEKDGSVTRLREERRDLFDLLYGDEDEMNDGEDGNVGKLLADSSTDRGDILFGDEDLDAFDPYGLDDY